MKLLSLYARCLLDLSLHSGRGSNVFNHHCLWGMMLIVLAVIASGCDTPQNPVPPKNYYYLNPNKKLSSIGRVVIVELENESNYMHISTDSTELLFQALQKKQVFGLKIVHRHDPSWRNLRLEEDTTFDLNQILKVWH